MPHAAYPVPREASNRRDEATYDEPAYDVPVYDQPGYGEQALSGPPYLEPAEVRPQAERPHPEEQQPTQESLIEAQHADDALLDVAVGEEPVDELGLLRPDPMAEKVSRGDRRARTPRKRGRKPLSVALSLAVIAALVTGIFYGGKAIVGLFAGDPAADYSGQGSGEVEVEIPDGASTSQIAEVLADNDVVASAEAFLNAAASNPDVRSIQPGFYAMRLQMSGEAALAWLLDPASKLLDRAIIPEGYTVARTLEALAEQTDIPLADFQAAAAATDQLGLPAWSNGVLEGFLYPATYDIAPNTTAVEILAAMVARFNEVAAATGLEADAAGVGLSPYELLTVASMVQSEVTVERERPLVARVIYNRLSQGIRLGIDATLAYELGINGAELTTEMLETDTPYNTRTRLGLPPTPISNPGEPSILGALQPAPGDWIYYVLQNSAGEHLFTASYQEFVEAKAQCEAAGLGCG
ncbi:MAG: endolytic transglycosylase MltG [Actinomycetota bacterium]|nr:endolytic transglycosylase MltG [Actinomycetota bacterium]